MGEMRKFRIGDILEGVPVETINAHTDYVLEQRSKLDSLEDTRKPKQKSPVIARLVWSGGSDIAAGSCVKLGNAVFDPASVAGAEFGGLSFYVSEYGAADIGTPYAITLGPITDGSGTPQVGYGFIPNCTWAKVNVIDGYQKYAMPTASGHILKTGWAGSRILWKPSGTGEKWAVIETARGPMHIQLGVVTDIIDGRGPTGYGGTADATFDLGNFPIVKLLLLDVGNEFDFSTADLPVLDNTASGMPDTGKVRAYDVRKEGSPKVGDVVRVWSSDGEHVTPGEAEYNAGTGEQTGYHFIYCDPLNVGDYLRGLSTYTLANYQVLIHQGSSSGLEWANVADVVTAGGGGGGGGGAMNSWTAGYALDNSGTSTDAIGDFDPTELTGFAAAWQFFRHISTDTGATQPHWKTVGSFDATKNQVLWHQSDTWSFKTTANYDAAKNQQLISELGTWNWNDAWTVKATINDSTASFLHDAIKDKVVAGTYVSGKDAVISNETDGAAATNQTERLFLDASAVSGFTASTVQLLGKDASDNLKWDTIAGWLNTLAGYTAGNNQSIGHDGSGATKWQDDGAC